MKHLAVRVRELVSSNVDAVVQMATDPAKALNLLRSEIEETLISLHSEQTMTKRQHERAVERSEQLRSEAETWTGKAQIAVDHGREDLARAALAAREDGLAKAALSQNEAQELEKDLSKFDAAIAELDTKRADIMQQVAGLKKEAQPAAEPQVSQDSKTTQRLDRIDELERRVAFQTDNATGPSGRSALTHADADAEIEALHQAKLIEDELAAMKASANKG